MGEPLGLFCAVDINIRKRYLPKVAVSSCGGVKGERGIVPAEATNHNSR